MWDSRPWALTSAGASDHPPGGKSRHGPEPLRLGRPNSRTTVLRWRRFLRTSPILLWVRLRGRLPTPLAGVGAFATRAEALCLVFVRFVFLRTSPILLWVRLRGRLPTPLAGVG